ncbi:LRR receptor-like serine/threonine-protein kinase FLS2 [Pistacia vera]|uniref:LRR receptor-like serine/threonine-protein kinase FLS2 n=1 Tax=Pistacia vera TaxID=55513 RepID=UPI0012636289|nr:LRR receptor-like serine/threonine-protein kinase FLS2 [Pistacia vera]
MSYLCPQQMYVLETSMYRTTAPLICFDIVSGIVPTEFYANLVSNRIPMQCDSESLLLIPRFYPGRLIKTAAHGTVSPAVRYWSFIELDLTSSYLYGSINSSSILPPGPSRWLSLGDNDSMAPNPLQKPGLRSLVENLTYRHVLALGHVNISSPIPDILANLSSLTTLSLKGCQLQGKFPTKIFQLPNLRVLSMRFNAGLNGSLPEFENNTPLEELRLGSTGFSGEIPYSIGNLNSLQILDLSNCSFFGSIPPSLGNLTKIRLLYLNQNGFSGELPTAIGNLSSLEELELSELRHDDERSSFLQFKQSLVIDRSTSFDPSAYPKAFLVICHHSSVLFIYQNERTDLVPVSYGYSLRMSTKGIELEYGRISNLLTAIISSSSKFEAEIPTSIANLTGLSFLVFSNNNLKGPIPPFMEKQTALESLDLLNNKLSGQISQQLQDLTFLSHFNVSNNHLTRPIPKGKQI